MGERTPPERHLAQYRFEGGGYIIIVVGGDVDTADALDMAETMIGLKRQELARRHGTGQRQEDRDG